MVQPPPAPPDTLNSSEAETLLALIEANGSILDAARARDLPPDALLTLLDRPGARRAMESLRALAALRRDIRADAARDELIDTLRHVARSTPDLVQKRLAATTALRALAADARPPLGRSALSLRSRARGAAFSSSSSNPPRRAIVHPAHDTSSVRQGAPSATGAGLGVQQSDADPLLDHSALSALSAMNSADGDLDPVLDEELDDALDAEEDAADDEAEDAALDAAYPETLALARRILADAQINPDAHDPRAIDAAQVLVDLEREHPTTHPP